MTFEQENAIRINTSIETNKSISETSRTHRIRWFDKTPKDLSVIRVPIKYLTYNFDNMRIESQLIEEIDNLGSELDFEEQDDREVYAGIFEETLLSGSDKLKTIRLKRSIKNTQQDTPGVITHGGIILDGNRRFMVIKGLFEEERIKNNGNPDKFKYMDVVRLDSGLSKSQLLAIQTLNQLYEIDIVGYTLINQALSIRKLKSFGYEREEIKKMFNFQKVSDVEEFEEILNFIDLFLEENNLQNKYTMIDKRNLFDHFRELRKLEKGHSRYTGLQGEELEEEMDLMRDVAFKWLKNNIDPQTVVEKKIMKSREVIRRLKVVVHRDDLRDTLKRVLSQDETLNGKREVHKLMSAAIQSAQDVQREERIYTLAKQVTDKLEEIQNIIVRGEVDIDYEQILEILEDNQELQEEIIDTVKLKLEE